MNRGKAFLVSSYSIYEIVVVYYYMLIEETRRGLCALCATYACIQLFFPGDCSSIRDSGKCAF
jgi:hypothetical protein